MILGRRYCMTVTIIASLNVISSENQVQQLYAFVNTSVVTSPMTSINSATLVRSTLHCATRCLGHVGSLPCHGFLFQPTSSYAKSGHGRCQLVHFTNMSAIPTLDGENLIFVRQASVSLLEPGFCRVYYTFVAL